MSSYFYSEKKLQLRHLFDKKNVLECQVKFTLEIWAQSR